MIDVDFGRSFGFGIIAEERGTQTMNAALLFNQSTKWNLRAGGASHAVD